MIRTVPAGWIAGVFREFIQRSGLPSLGMERDGSFIGIRSILIAPSWEQDAAKIELPRGVVNQ